MDEPVVVIDKRGRGQTHPVNEAIEAFNDTAQAAMARNVASLAGNLWWHAQGAGQRGDHVEASRHSIARSRVLAEAERRGVIVGG